MARQEARPRCGYYFVRPLWGLFFNLAVEWTHEPCVPTLLGLMTDRVLELSVLTMGLVVDRGCDSYVVVCFIVFYLIFMVCCSKRYGGVLCM